MVSMAADEYRKEQQKPPNPSKWTTWTDGKGKRRSWTKKKKYKQTKNKIKNVIATGHYATATKNKNI